MVIDGKAIAENILQTLATDVLKLKQLGVTPTLSVILVGDAPDSLSYIKSKQKAADRIGAHIDLLQLSTSTTNEELRKRIHALNIDPLIHGIIIQRPLPSVSPVEQNTLESVNPAKDVDGFVRSSPFHVPVAQAVFTILNEIYSSEKQKNSSIPDSFTSWLKPQRIAVIGRGETAGKPIADLLIRHGFDVSIIHSQTSNEKDILKLSHIIISCVGKPQIVTHDVVHTSSILISVGISHDQNGKLHGDYDEDEIRDIVRYYTPTPGGVGPVNVACLMQNLVASAKQTINF